MNILIVDDHTENQYLLEVLLTGNGHSVTSSANGEEALRRIKSGNFDLIISDILMPVMDGFELCRQIRSDDRFKHLPIIIYTATYTGPQDEVFALKIGADRFIRKPCEPEFFMNSIRELMQSTYVQKKRNTDTDHGEGEILKLYNERLVRKLEQKMFQLEDEIENRKRAEETLRKSEVKYRTLYNSIRDAIFVCDNTRIIIDCNPAFVELLGFGQNEIKGKKTTEIIEDKAAFSQWTDKFSCRDYDTGAIQVFNFIKKDVSVFPGEMNVYCLVNDDGLQTGFAGLIRDISQKKQSEEAQKKVTVSASAGTKDGSCGPTGRRCSA